MVGLLLAVPASAITFELPPAGESVVGNLQIISTRYEDTLVHVARQNNVGYRELRLANPEVDSWLPGEYTPVVVPTFFVLPDAPRKGIVLNLPEMRLYYYPPPKRGERPVVVTYPVSVGRRDWSTPLGKSRIVRKQENPTWTPPASIRKEHAERGDTLPAVVKPGPDNPLGKHALYLDKPGYLLHGTNQPAGVGMRVTHGCVRLFPEDIETLFAMVPIGTPVYLVNQPYKAGWRDGVLYFEAHPPDADGRELPPDFKLMQRVINKALGEIGGRPDYPVDWRHATRLAAFAEGIPLSLARTKK